MNIQLFPESLYHEAADAKILFYYQDAGALRSVAHLEEGLEELVGRFLGESSFQGDFLEVQSFLVPIHSRFQPLILAGLGEQALFNPGRIRKVLAKSIKVGKQSNFKSMEVNLCAMKNGLDQEEFVRILSETSILANYQFDQYLSNKKGPAMEALYILCAEEDYETLLVPCREGCILGNATVLARDLVNEPANVLTPSKLGEEAEKIGDTYGFEVDILEESELKELGMESYLEVAKASANPPKLIVMRYLKDDAHHENRIGFIGKGVTFDSGGLSLKRGERMKTMKHDMAGGAAVLGAMSAIASMDLKVNVIGIIPACENMLSGNSYRPGDIINSMAGKSILIGSTDAEGRLTLIDAIHYAIEKENVTKLVDIASLTGVARTNFGAITTAVLCNDDELFAKLQSASERADEKIWRMPMFDEYKDCLKSDIADLVNTAGEAGMITAGLFIHEFVQDKPWIHMDIAGTCWTDKELDYSAPGGTGTGTRGLYYLAKALSE